MNKVENQRKRKLHLIREIWSQANDVTFLMFIKITQIVHQYVWVITVK